MIFLYIFLENITFCFYIIESNLIFISTYGVHWDVWPYY